MNSLSWLIYAANIAGSVNGFLIFLAFLMGIFFIVAIIVAVIHIDETRGYTSLRGQELEDCRKTKRNAFKAAIAFFFGMTLMGTSAAIVPDRQTVLLIAASEIGERIITHQRVQNIVDPSINLLQAWMVQQTQEIQRQMQNNGRR